MTFVACTEVTNDDGSVIGSLGSIVLILPKLDSASVQKKLDILSDQLTNKISDYFG